MSPKYANLLFQKGTPQSQPVPSSISTAPQAMNNAGGFVFSLDKWKRLERFLILGSDGNTYYSKAEKLTKENAECVTECWTEDALKTGFVIHEISTKGRAPKNSPAIFALALGCIHKDTLARQIAFAHVPLVCRTSTHLFEFVSTMKALGKGWGRGMKTAVANWYNNKTDDQLAYQLIKYRQREGYTHERLIRLSHPKKAEPFKSLPRSAMYDWLRGRETTDLPDIIMAHRAAMAGLEDIVPLLKEYNLPWEALPTWANTKKEVWQAQLEKMPLNALIRNLGNMTRLDVFDSEELLRSTFVRLSDVNEIKKAKLHPFNILNGMMTYKSGHGFRGSNSWSPHVQLLKALNNAFYESFSLIEPSNKRILLAMDVSSSMDGSKLFNSNLSAREASAAMAMATLNVEENVHVVGFTSLHSHNYGHHLISLDQYMRRGASIDEIIQKTTNLPHSGTDCALPMLYAMQSQLDIDAFVVYTDSETWAGDIQPVEALREYRRLSGKDAKLIVVGMTSTGFSIADPNDEGMLDIVGFDSTAPAVIASFIHGSQGLLEDHTSATSSEGESQEEENPEIEA